MLRLVFEQTHSRGMFSWPPGVAREGSGLSPAETAKKTRTELREETGRVLFVGCSWRLCAWKTEVVGCGVG